MAQAAAQAGRALSWTWPGSLPPTKNLALPSWPRDYFSDNATPERAGRHAGCAVRCAALLPPRGQRAASKKRPAEILQQALAGDREERSSCRRRLTPGRNSWSAASARSPSASSSTKILFKPDKNGARVQGRGRGQPARRKPRRCTCCKQAGAIDRALPVPLAALPARQLPQGHRFSGTASAPADPDDLPLASVQAYSIDDSHDHRNRRCPVRCRAWAAAP